MVLHDGIYYGTTSGGGTASHGTIYSLNPTGGAQNVLYNFSGGADGGTPLSPLVFYKGAFYGTTFSGGAMGDGTVYKFDPVTNTETVIHSFVGTDGMQPEGAVVIHGGAIYGGTQSGGSHNYTGVVYKTSLRTGKTKVLHSFADGPDGEGAVGGLVYDAGLIYGTALGGGVNQNGTLYEINPATGGFTVVYSFSNASTTGSNPQSGLLLHSGMLYGTTYGGGASGNGGVFKFNPSTTAETLLYSFAGGTDGALPAATPIFHAGALYGTTSVGGPADSGTIYKLVLKHNVELVLYSFTGGGDGGHPGSPLVYGNSGFYGVTVLGGSANFGTLFYLQ